MDEAFDVCIVGSGASGAIMATELRRFGFNVALIEKGDWWENVIRDMPAHKEDHFAEDELYFKHWMPFIAKNYLEPTLFSETDSDPETVTSLGYTYNLIGGGTCLYAGASWRFRERDFKKLSYYGHQPGASMVDWPISYDDLQPYYDKAEIALGISGDVSGDPTEPDRERTTLQPPIEADKFSQKLIAGAKQLGLNPSFMPMSLATQVQDGDPCKLSGWCSGFPCRFNSKSSVDARLLAPLLGGSNNYKTERLKIFHNTVALRIETNSRGLCTGVLCRTKAGNDIFIKSKFVVLAASAIQTARLALLSDSNLFPDGLGNHNGQLGKNLMFHIYDKVMGTFSESFPFRVNKLIAINDFYHPSVSDSAFPNACSIMSGSKWMPIKYAKNKIDPKTNRPGWGKRFMTELASEYSRSQLLQAAVEDLPQESNCVTLHPSRVDRYGLPAAKVTHKYHECDIEAMRNTLDKCAAIMDASGADVPYIPSPKSNITGNYTYHLMGTCRMGKDENTSVVDANCRFHSVPNLFAIDGSVFPTSSALNPTLTIQANAYRVAQKIFDSASGKGESL